MTESQDEADPWVTLSEAASRTGRHIDAVRYLVRRRKLPARKGNSGAWLVQLPASLTQPELATDAAGDTALLLAEVTELLVALAEAMAEAKAAHDIADARIDAVKAKTIAARELADRLTQELAELRRPWWRRWIGQG